ncbi:Methyltransferase domain-containing protein [Neorhodopirellula lusitana]|uniref:Methyltransferase domain-containing protein n=1 Tax=Neorhodopirellula lusitana TaxID=445327 RepID=A0ABY1QQC9_9BACT|nr:class I SAM-dependent methyltransferase [Neorhodopirellula lusitana]SMP77406.1 Methyltransferase domain-containing protein [Neorhodopirellula lusitana]
MPQQLMNWYDRPQYFDMVFRDETNDEVRFFEKAFAKLVDTPVKRLYEPGCGSGRLVAAMAGRGYELVATDNNDAMLAYLQKRLKRRGLPSELLNTDMTTHVCKPAVDAAFCTFNTFRHLLDADSAETHLRSVADSLRPGGIYILGFHCIPLDADPDCTERWSAMHGGTKVSVTLRVINFERRKRRETLRVSIKATKANGQIERIRSEFQLRLYTPAQAKTLLKSVDDVFEIASVHDFDYDLDEQRKMDNDLTDAVFILRKR